MAAEARRQGWRVVAFAFPGSADLGGAVDAMIPCRIDTMAPVLASLDREKVSGVLLSGKFWMGDLLAARAPDAAHANLATRAGALLDGNITQAIVGALNGMGIELLDQRPFLGDWLGDARLWSVREPGEAEWRDIRRGFTVARLNAEASVGQTVVVKRGVVSAVEAIEGTTETIRRGTALSGSGAVVVKAVARGHDFRFDTPAIGCDTLQAAAAGGATAVAVQARSVMILDAEATVRCADAAGIALVSADDAD